MHMNDQTLQAMWKESGERLSESRLLNMQSWVLNIQVFTSLRQQKARRQIRKLLLPKLAAALLGLLYIWLVAELMGYFRSYWPALVAGSGILVLTGWLVADYLIQVFRILRLDFDAPVLRIQKELLSLQSSIIRSLRISFLQAPFYSFAFAGPLLWKQGGLLFWGIQALVTGGFLLLAIYVFLNLKLENSERPWVKRIIADAGGKSLSGALELLEEIREFEKDQR